MSTLNWSLLSIVHSFDDVKVVAKSNGVCQRKKDVPETLPKLMAGRYLIKVLNYFLLDVILLGEIRVYDEF